MAGVPYEHSRAYQCFLPEGDGGAWGWQGYAGDEFQGFGRRLDKGVGP